MSHYKEPTERVHEEQYCSTGRLEIRAVGAKDWDAPEYEWTSSTNTNVLRPTFTPGELAVYQFTAEAVFGLRDRLQSDLYMWRTSFKLATFHDIRVKESQLGGQFPRIKIEMIAVCKTRPTGEGLLTSSGTERGKFYSDAQKTTEATARNCALANISERWNSGDQEVKLSFTRVTHAERKHGKNLGKEGPKAFAGGKVWVWQAFMAFLTGSSWTSATQTQFKNAALVSLAHIVDSGSSYADFEKMGETGWVLVKP